MDIKELSKILLEDASYVDKLTDEQVELLRRGLNPYAVDVKQNKESFINISLVNWREQWLTRLVTVSTIGYMNRIADEWDPREDVAFGDKLMSETEVKAEREVIKRFLNRHFKYNPDHHVRSSYGENKADPERKPLAQVVADAKAALGPVSIDPKWFADESAGVAAQVAGFCVVANKFKDSMCQLLTSLGGSEAKDCEAIITKQTMELKERASAIGSKVAGIRAAETLRMVKNDPPVDLYHHMRRYMQNHYESLREVVDAVYNEKPDLEFCAIYYSHHKTQEEAKEFRIKNERDFKAEVFTLEPGVSILGPFKENRDRVDFYNKNMEVIKKLSEQMEADQKLGEDMMKKKIKNKKAKSVAEVGKDAPGLAQYTKDIGTIESLGTKQNLSSGEAEALAQAKQRKEMAEVPDDAIKVDVFYVDGTSDRSLKKTHFYTAAEAPKHMEEGSEFTTKYQ